MKMFQPIKYLIVLSIFISSLNLSAQKECLVLKPQIANKYEGKCKNGLAHGKGKATGLDTYVGHFKKGLPNGEGTYTWSNGDVYVGDWLEGFRDGEGSFTFKQDGRDTTIQGLWKKDEYMGPVPKEPEVLTSRSVDRHSFDRMSDIKNRVLIDFYQNGVRNRGIENMMMYSTSGYETNRGESVGYDEVTFPVTIKLNYLTWNKMRSAQIYVIFEFKIYEPGDWQVTLHN